MANFTNLQITNKGIEVELLAQGGEELRFTKFMVGDGTYTGNIKTLTALVNPIMTLDVRRLNVSTEDTNKKVIVGFNINTEDVTTGFYLKEIGIYVNDPNTNQDVLAFYGNAGSNADYIAPSGSSTIAEKLIDIEINIDSVNSITAEIDSSLVYVAKSDIVDSLTSTDTESPLSAKQGKVLDEKFNDYLPKTGGTVSGDLASNRNIKCDEGEFCSRYTANNDIVAHPSNLWISDNGWIHRTSHTPAPKNHASYDTEFGAAGDQVYGHVRLIDELGATNHNIPWALHACQGKVLKDMIDTKAQTNHASYGTEYGTAGDQVYGHVRLINSLNANNSNIAWALHANQGKVLKDMIDEKFNITGGTITGNLNVYSNIETQAGNICANLGAFQSQSTYDFNVVSNAANVYITAHGWIRRTNNTSSKRYKQDIKDLTDEKLNPERLYDLKIKQFKYKEKYQPNEKDSRYNKDLIGFIAEDLEDIYPIAVDYQEDENGNQQVDNWNERYLIPAMLKLIQDQKKQIDDLQTRVDKLEEKLN